MKKLRHITFSSRRKLSPQHASRFDVMQFLRHYVTILFFPIATVLGVMYSLISYVFEVVFKGKSKKNIIISVGVCAFAILVFHMANLQIFSYRRLLESQEGVIQSFSNITLSRRGQIYISDYARNQSQIALTSSEILYNLVIDPFSLSSMYSSQVTQETIARALAQNLNVSYSSVLSALESVKDSKSRYMILERFISPSQAQTAKLLIQHNPDKLAYKSWLAVEEVLSRSYPNDDLLGSTLGYVPIYKVLKEEVLQSDCRDVVVQNENNNAGLQEYTVGYYGLEQRYCALLAGLNGKKMYQSGSLLSQDSSEAVDGADLFLTIDLTMQKKADELLEQYVAQNTNQNGKPENASIIVMEAKTGKILALSSYPNFNPNSYFNYESEAYRNVATSVDYEVGSTMKPLTVAAALSEYELGTIGTNGQRIGVSPTFFKRDYGADGKRYQEKNGTFTPSIRNSQGISYASDPTCCDLKRTIRDSLNTMISDIVDSIGTVKLAEYFKDKYLFDQETEVAFAGGGSGNLTTLNSQIDCLFCFAQHGFGQGLYISPIQLMRAFTAIANDGYLVEPYLVQKIEYPDGRVDTGDSSESIIHRPEPKQVLTQQSARLTAEYMKAVIDEGYLGRAKLKNSIPGYSVSAKTGTAQITRPDKDGKPCSYACNTEKGLFDHSLIGFAPTVNPEIMVMVKIAEPQPGVKTNFSDATSMPTFKNMMQFALEYRNVPKDR